MKITSLNSNELIVIAVNNSGDHSSGLAKFAFEQKWLSSGNNGGLDITGKSFAINAFRGLDSIAAQVKTLADYAKSNPDVTVFMSDFGLRNGKYSRFELWNILEPYADLFDFTYAELLTITQQGIAPLRGEFTLSKLVDEPKNANQFLVTKVAFDSDNNRWFAFEPWYVYQNKTSKNVTLGDLKDFVNDFITKVIDDAREAAELKGEELDMNDVYEAHAGDVEVTTEAEARSYIQELLADGYTFIN